MDSSNAVAFADEELFLFLLKIYRWDQDHADHSVSLWEMAPELEFSNSDAQLVADLLQRKGLLTFVSLAGHVSLTSLGTFEVMLALSRPNKPTRYFPAIENFNNIALTVDSFQHGNIDGFVGQLREFCSDLSLTEDMSDHLHVLIEKLDTAVQVGKGDSKAVVSELKAIDDILNVQLQAH